MSKSRDGEMKVKYFLTAKIKYKDKFGDSVCMAFEQLTHPAKIKGDYIYRFRTYYGFSAN